MYLFQQYHSPRCWKTKEQAYEIFEGLKFKKDRMSSIKEQILIRYLGLGWVEAHHPWSKKGHGTYSPTELLEHFVNVVLPLAEFKKVPAEPPLELPGLPNICRLGTRAKDCIDLCIQYAYNTHQRHCQKHSQVIFKQCSILVPPWW